MKTRLITNIIAGLALTMVSSSAMALINAELLVGKRWYKMEDENETTTINGQVIHVGAHLDPIPLVPVAFGLGIDTISLSTEEYGEDVDSASILDIGLEIKAWVPMIPVVTPYAKINIPVSSTYILKGSSDVTVDEETKSVDYAATGEFSGFHLNVGAEMSIIPLMSVLFEVGMGSQKFTLTEVEQGDVKSDEQGDPFPANSNSFLVGIKVGF